MTIDEQSKYGNWGRIIIWNKREELLPESKFINHQIIGKASQQQFNNMNWMQDVW
jgi:hypothetical protein